MNCVKHHDKEHGAINISAETTENEVIFTISDDGPGVPAEYQDKVFRLLQQVYKSEVELEPHNMQNKLFTKHLRSERSSLIESIQH